MAAEWAEVTVEQIAAPIRNALVGGPFGSNLVSHDYVDRGVPVIRGQNMGGRWVSGDFAFVTEEKAERLAGNLARPNDIVFTQRGTLGQVSLVPDGPFEKYLVSQSQMKLTVNRALADPRFFYYVFVSTDHQRYVHQQAIQTGVPHTNLAILRGTPIPLPPIEEQRTIAHILGTLDDKIELNRRMSETLEAMARALFESWFVDFDPVRAKLDGRWQRGQSLPGLPAHPYDLFPDRLVESELGEIPDGWRLGTLDDIVVQHKESVKPAESAEREFVHFSLPAFDDGQTPHVERGEAIKSNKWRVLRDSVLLSKLNPEIDRTWLVDVNDDDGAICSTEFLVLAATAPFGRAYVYCLARSQAFRQQLESMVTGTSKSHQRVQPAALMELPTLLPDAPTLAAFDLAVSPWVSKVLVMRRESRTLATLRDTLLPKLISGELRVKDAERFVSAAA